MDSEPKNSPRLSSRLLRWIIRIFVLTCIGLWLSRGADLSELGAALERLSAPAAALCLALMTTNIVIASARWLLLMKAFGARKVPSFLVLFRLLLVGHFYNTFIPGAVGGDAVRGFVARTCFERPTASFAVVILDRLLGLSTLVCLLLAGLWVGPRVIDPSEVWPWVSLVVGVGLVAIAAGVLVGKLQNWWRELPRIDHLSPVAAAAILSGLSHCLSITCFGVLCHELGGGVPVTTLLLIVPLGLVAAVIPLAIAGVGPREAALVGLLGMVGIAKTDSLAISLSFAGVLIVIALIGGLIQMVSKDVWTAGLTAGDDTNESSGGAPPRD